jgi:UDP-3-O-[3-hydroxymyristoyl] glucosamine N-acyltransferase
MRIAELAEQIGAKVIGDGSADVTSAATLEDARPGQISFLSNPKYARQLETTKASAVIVAGSMRPIGTVALLETPEPYAAFARALELLHGQRKHPFAGIHPSAHVDKSATIGPGTVVYPGAYVGPRSRLGRDCIVYPNATIYDDCVLGDRVIVHAGAVIGADGYGFATVRGEHHKVPQIGNVLVENDVEIGANTCIDRAAIGSTVIGRGTKIDDLVMIGHNVRIGAGSLVVAQAGIAGSVEIGRHATIAGQAGIAGHLVIGDNVTIGAKAGVISDVPDQSTVMGVPAMPVAHGRRVYSIFTQLPELLERVRQLEQQVEELSSGDGADVV